VKVTAVKFKSTGKIYVFRCDDLDLHMNDWVVVETDQGLGMSWVVVEPWEPDPENVPGDLKSVVRLAQREDLEKAQKLREQEKKAREVCKELIEKHGLPMKLVEVETLFEGSKMVFFFTAENRVDFRKLVKDLARRFRCKVEMRQIGVRNEAKIMGGLGGCGRELCCCTFLNNFEPVSVRMAKDQNLSLNPLKISGVCGRLMCCLAYEHDTYLDLKKRFPDVRKWVNTQRGVGRVKRLNVLADRVVLEMDDNQEVEVSLDEVLEILPCKPDQKGLDGKEG
jgi:cell fate regulator YaaT (PSP1 superfamily)